MRERDLLEDFVFPLVSGNLRPDGTAEPDRYRGTGFLIGGNYAITAGHVLKAGGNPIAARLIDDEVSAWRFVNVLDAEYHPTEDVALVQLKPPELGAEWGSIYRLSADPVAAGQPYYLHGYPEDTWYERVQSQGFIRPELVFSEGHIRRRITDVAFPNIKGAALLELSQVGDAGCSGSPVFDRRPWRSTEVIGVYIGERTDSLATSVGYAARVEALTGWVPGMLGQDIIAAFGPQQGRVDKLRTTHPMGP